MKKLYILALMVFFLPTLSASASDVFPATVESMTDATVTLITTRAAEIGEYYSASCSPYTGVEESGMYTVHTSITVPNLTEGTEYTCRIYIYPSDTGGVTQGMSEDIVFVAGDPDSVVTENQPPVINQVTVSPDPSNKTYDVGEQITWSAGASDPNGDQIRYKFWLCEHDGAVCAAFGSQEWTTDHQFTWMPEAPGEYGINLIVLDDNHQDESHPWGDDSYEAEFTVVGEPLVVDVTEEPPAGYEEEVLTEEQPTINNPFPDTSINELEGKAAADLYEKAIIGGYPDGQFKGYQPVNRAEAAKFLLEALYDEVYETENNGKFWDVKEGEWYVKYIMVAAIKGVIEGYSDGSFKPENTVNTAEFLKMLTKTFNLSENLSYSYSDVSSSAWYAPYAGVAEKYNLFPEKSEYLYPASELSRKDVAIVIYQYLQNK